MDLSVTPNIVFALGPINVTSGHLGLMFLSTVLLIWAFYTRAKADLVPTRSQVFFEAVFEWFDEKVIMSTPERYRKFNFAMAVTLFLMILLCNFHSFYPFLDYITYNGERVFSTPTAHMSMPLALGLFVVLLSQAIAIITHPLKHIANYIQFHKFLKVRSVPQFFNTLIEVFLGLLDIIGEIAKIVSISARLFGNMVSGALMSAVIIGLSAYTQFIAPIPFYALGFLAALIQAVVFALLASLYFGGTLAAVDAEFSAE